MFDLRFLNDFNEPRHRRTGRIRPGGDPSLLTFLSELVVDEPLLGVAEHLVGLGDLLELVLGVGVLVLVGVEAQRHAAVRLLDLLLVGALGDAQGLVVVLPHSCTHAYTPPPPTLFSSGGHW